MADDERTDSPDARSEELAEWLTVEPLDDVTRRRLVATAVRADDHSVRAPARAWRWLAAAAAVVILLVGGLALLTAPGGNDEQQASTPVQTPAVADSTTPKSSELSAALDAGDFGDLDQPANLAKLRAALAGDAAFSQRESTAPTPSADSASGAAASSGTASRLTCFLELPEGAVVVSRGTGTISGRRATVVLTALPDGSRSYDAVLENPCEIRSFGSG